MKIILVSHGSYAKAMMESVQMLVGQQTGLEAYGLYPDDSTATLKEQLEEAIKNSEGEEILFLTDLFHGSPFNVVVSLMEHHDVSHIAGISLALLLEAIMQRNSECNVSDICDNLVSTASTTVHDVKKALEEAIEE